MRARLALVGDANDGRRGGFRKGLDGGRTGDEVFRRFLGGSSIAIYGRGDLEVGMCWAIECLAVMLTLMSRDAPRASGALSRTDG